jgi:uncharacterized membrane protein
MPPEIKVLLVSIVPIVELKGGIPIGVAAGLPVLHATVLGMAGTSIQVPFNLLLLHILIHYGTRLRPLERFLAWTRERSGRHERTVRRYGIFGVVLLVGIPLPGTGLWTGTVAGYLIGMKQRDIVIALLLGVVAMGAIVGLGAAGVVRVFGAAGGG